MLQRAAGHSISTFNPPSCADVPTLARAPWTAVIRGTDGGPGLAPADAERLGERFFRVMGTGASGSGLGWSIERSNVSWQLLGCHGRSRGLAFS
jgi:hypothetical protein